MRLGIVIQIAPNTSINFVISQTQLKPYISDFLKGIIILDNHLSNQSTMFASRSLEPNLAHESEA